MAFNRLLRLPSLQLASSAELSASAFSAYARSRSVGGSRPAQVLRRQMTRLSVESDRAELESVDDGISLPVV